MIKIAYTILCIMFFLPSIGQTITDLQLRSITITKNRIAPGSPLDLKVAIYNAGSDTVNTSLSYYLSNDIVLDAGDTLLSTTAIVAYPDSIESFQPLLQIDSLTTEGKYFLFVKADAFNLLPELDENNNMLYSEIHVGIENIDLKIAFEDTITIEIKHRGYLQFNTEIENKGTTFSGIYDLMFHLSTDSILGGDNLLKIDRSLGLEGGKSELISQEVYFSERIRPGSYYIIASVDADSIISETNENNNRVFRKVTILPLDNDFTVSIDYSDSVLLTPGSTFTVEATVFNNGNDTSFAQNLAFFLSKDTLQDNGDFIVGSENIPSLGAQRSINLNPSLSIPATLQEGKYYLIAVSDISRDWQETNELNNTYYIPLQIGEVITGITDAVEIQNDINLYPNPSTGVISFSSLVNIDEVEVTDITGASKLIQRSNIDKNLDLRALGTGIFTVKLKKAGQILSTHKVVLTE